jgi:hypothetical protein
MQLAEEKLNPIIAQDWTSYCEHVVRQEEEY